VNRKQIKALAATLINEALGSETEGDPFALDDFLDLVVDELAGQADLYFKPSATTLNPAIDLGIGTIRYPIPNIHHITSATVKSSGGARRVLSVVTPEKMDKLYGPRWRNTTGNWAPADIGNTTAVPTVYAVAEGATMVRLAPGPSTARTGGLEIEGYGSPGNEAWPAETDACPLPIWSHKAVAYLLALERELSRVEDVEGNRIAVVTSRANALRDEVIRKAGGFAKSNAGTGRTTATGGDQRPREDGTGRRARRSPATGQ
jgi:hypothetical protein